MTKIILIGLVILLAIIYSCSMLSRNSESYSINSEELRQMLEENSEIVLLDVRTEQEFNGELGHMDGAILIPLQSLENRYHELYESKDKTIIVYCRSGHRSTTASEFLIGKGFKIKNLSGGIKAWNSLNQK